MRHTQLVAAVLGLLVALAWPGAQAKTLNGRLGLGLEQSLGGVSGLTVRYWPGRDLGLLATVGATVVTDEPGDTESLGTSVGASLGFVYNVSSSLHGNLGLGARVALGYQSARTADGKGGTQQTEVLQLGLEIPLVIEYFLSDSFSVSVATGLLVLIVPDEGAVLVPEGHGSASPAGATVLGLGSGSITGSLGAVYYF